jgi:hypothetical protein
MYAYDTLVCSERACIAVYIIRIESVFTVLVSLSISVCNMQYVLFSFACHISGTEGCETRHINMKGWHEKLLKALADQKVSWSDLWPPSSSHSRKGTEEEALSRHRTAMALTYNSSLSEKGTA